MTPSARRAYCLDMSVLRLAFALSLSDGAPRNVDEVLAETLAACTR